jgi:ferredoxin
MRLAKAMAYRLNCRIADVQEALSMDLSAYKAIGLGSGIYFTSHHPKILELAGRLDPFQKAFIFSSRGGPFLGNYHKPLKEELSKRNIDFIGEFSSKGFDCTGPFIIIHGGNKGRPNEKDEQKAERFISAILPQYVKDLNIVPKGRFVHVDDACVGCGKCTDVCPMKVFVLRENKSAAINERACIHCSLCQKECPSQAISIQHTAFEAIGIAKRHAKKKSL